ncbi:RedY protein [Streptomyces aurantiogriseus]|uniref:RedY protein n=1 Tax=Streptomyces aurantiogriseus TaxID=66870 RepID=A0A918FJ70_9ACTN|nr:RedY protein [Streptomyces aurantiogriseus]GGR41861.1 RedY protein [Streptomyces aurantiogriseus]
MHLIIHRIRLRAETEPARFEDWVRHVDYAACSELPSVLSFSVQRVSADPGAPFHYVEVIEVGSRVEFERDMGSEVFRGLVAGFGTMAEVVDEVVGERVGPGYRAAC